MQTGKTYQFRNLRSSDVDYKHHRKHNGTDVTYQLKLMLVTARQLEDVKGHTSYSKWSKQ
jgi:hypothetical protein